MYTSIKIVWAVIAASLIFLVLLHSPKGDGLGGIGGQAQLFSSTKSAETTLNRVTWALTVLFLALTVILSGGWISPASIANPAVVPGNSAKPTKANPAATTAPAIPVPQTLPSETPSETPSAAPTTKPSETPSEK
ncbi:preprotein translocase subunit SecG [Tumidithrix elongata RA019]|uniref:Protein-export membrane protein SecG n=1 Tax=Tumidithrix elongata BACA0141 TaxID=2716417 RepID=A0AAW9PY93_9CYAN|nr:preprotein translocase subunit SecG [Tumidithrix elongata RA019]